MAEKCPLPFDSTSETEAHPALVSIAAAALLRPRDFQNAKVAVFNCKFPN